MDIKEYIVQKNVSILEAMNAINKNSRGIVYVCDGKRLIGALSDGDIRRHILSGGSLDETAEMISSKPPKYLNKNSNKKSVEYMRECNVTSLPIINNERELTSIKFLNARGVYDYKRLNIPVVIMAGGEGTRLQPLTNVLPKPLIPIGEKTITERIMDNFLSFNCNEFNIIVNYKKNLIKSYFAEIPDYDISYFEEDTFLGTAGGLKLIEKKIEDTFFLTNCDIIVDDDYNEIVQHHKRTNAIITLVCTLKNYTIPYGTIKLNEDGGVESLEEKPSYSFLVNTGMYVIEPRFLNYIPENTFIHITDIIDECIKAGEIVSMYPVSENAWMDMGQFEELAKMQDVLIGDK